MFLNRQKELERLENDFLLPTSTMTFVFGRKQVGKTALINEHIKNKESVYLSCIEILPTILFENFTFTLNESFAQLFDCANTFESFLELLYRCEIKKKRVIVLEDFQNLLKVQKDALQSLQKFWNRKLKYKNIQLIISSSVHSSVQEDKKVYDNASEQIILKSLEFSSIKAFIKEVPKSDLMYIYAALGTNAKYLKQYERNKDFMLNIKEMFLDPQSPIFYDGLNMVKNDLSEIGTYASILHAIAKGKSKIGDIAQFLEVKSSYLTRYLQKLLDMMVIVKMTPIGDDPKKSKFGRYYIEDNYLKFWFVFIYPNMSQLQSGNTYGVISSIRETFSKQLVQEAYKRYIFELVSNNPEEFLGYSPIKIGRWWNNKVNEIDMVAYDNSEISFIDCKWRTKQDITQEYTQLKQKSEHFDTVLNKNFIIFSKESS